MTALISDNTTNCRSVKPLRCSTKNYMYVAFLWVKSLEKFFVGIFQMSFFSNIDHQFYLNFYFSFIFVIVFLIVPVLFMFLTFFFPLLILDSFSYLIHLTFFSFKIEFHRQYALEWITNCLRYPFGNDPE